MDPLSQAVTGAAAAAIFARKSQLRPVLVAGGLSGLAADLDIFIRSNTDPLLALEYHRHFTHALPFAPLGALLCALVFLLIPWVRNRLDFGCLYLCCLLGYTSHGLLDACTGYGTRLWWPFSDYRESWNIIAVIDPFYTLPALLLLALGLLLHCRRCVGMAMVWMLAYLGLGVWQEARVYQLAESYLQTRQITAEKLTVRPTIGNLWVWRVLYADPADERWHSFALHAPFWGGEPRLHRGESAEIYRDERHAYLPESSSARRDIERFRYFSDGYLSWHPLPGGRSGTIADARYSMLPQLTQRPLWGIQIPRNPQQHAALVRFPRELDWPEILAMLAGEGSEPFE